jgi:glycosyltransferase involved in cell wall biosynthesis/Sec-independent protein translocase protein TatA
MATYNDFNGVYFTLQALRWYQDMRDTELLVIDNYGCQDTKALVEDWVHGRYLLATEVRGTAAPRDLVFREARGEAVLCCDSHVMFAPGAIGRLKEYYREHPDCPDLFQGPLVYDDLEGISTHFEPVWRDEMWGIWATDPRGQDPEGEPFEIPMQGLGAFSCRKGAWPGFNPMFRGFGGEEGYIHEKFRQAGGRCLCLPWFRWMHRFDRPGGVQYPLTVEDKLRNYLIGHAELGLDLTPVLAHFSEIMPEDRVEAVVAKALGGPQTPEEPQAPEVDAGAAGGGAAPATLSEGADQVLQNPLLLRLPSPLLALLLIVFGPERLQRLPSPLLTLLMIVFGPARSSQMAREGGRVTPGARDSDEESKAEPLHEIAEDEPGREDVEHARHQPEERAPVVVSVAARSGSDARASSRPAHAGPGPEATLPLVSCICPTYNRPPHHQHLLEEAIASYLRQDYPNKELIVLNDCPGQELICSEPGVRVVNVAERFPSIGDKHNAAVGLARGELIAPWDDDDISLPWRLSLSVERLGDADYFNPRCYWFLDNDGLHVDHSVGYAHNASLFRRAAFEEVGRYPSVPMGADAVIDAAFSRSAHVVDPLRGDKELTRSEWFYIYRWGVSPVHVSGSTAENFYREIGKLPVVEGRFHLSPHWRRDYAAETRRLLDLLEV